MLKYACALSAAAVLACGGEDTITRTNLSGHTDVSYIQITRADAQSDTLNGVSFCGDQECGLGENCSTCATDCGECLWCGDGVCGDGEDCQLCPNDCGQCNGGGGAVGGCGDGVCADTESTATCFEDCGSWCGDGACNGNESPALCPQDCANGGGGAPGAGDCSGCVGGGNCLNHCLNKGHDDGYCGAPGSKNPDVCCVCLDDNPPPPAPFCGDGACNGNESSNSCSQDCGAPPPPAPFCGDGSCNGNESSNTCSQDCGAPPPPPAPPAVAGPDPGKDFKGYIDGVFLVGGKYRVTGWACHMGWTGAMDVHLYVGGSAGSGSLVKGATANKGSEAAVAAECQAGGNHRFSIPLTSGELAAHKGKKVFVHGISPVGKPNKILTQSGVHHIP